MPLTNAPDSGHAPLEGGGGQAAERLAGQSNLLQLVELRWLAVGGQLATILLANFALDVPLPLGEMLTLMAVLALFNCASALRARLAFPVGDAELLVQLLVDVGVLTGQLYFAGGVTNPFIFLYLLQVAVASVLLRPMSIWVIVLGTSMGFVALTAWHRPLAGAPVLSADYVGGLLMCFVLNAALLVIFIGRIMANLRRRDASVARLKQRAAEEEHIVRMGLLASGAAHELGTPLATLSVILGDWARMAPFAGEPELREEIEEMQRQVLRCKAIVSGILTSAGETRAEAPAQTTLHAFLDGLVAEWQRTRGVATLAYSRDDVPDLPIFSDTALRQMIDNVLDNALEAAPDATIRFLVGCDEETLTVRVQDRGPGFPESMLERFGTPYQSSKGKPGRGLGLFLAVNVARTLGGRIEAHNLPAGGAEVVITLPLATLMPEESEDDGER
ncbi:HAMP domain-containing histidine kinase [Ramlibacter sp. G-1-2-2]|uniref:histidine kinase n=1 Tax=Ramlibacter agri TaxID=2728837 RepID=A0A848H191_9BURK|nr:ATP-binding protein [Ramlibacter agri]NML42890.1 HAMP domain-containing histidine kinase [Ramlibacter agri]